MVSKIDVHSRNRINIIHFGIVILALAIVKSLCQSNAACKNVMVDIIMHPTMPILAQSSPFLKVCNSRIQNLTLLNEPGDRSATETAQTVTQTTHYEVNQHPRTRTRSVDAVERSDQSEAENVSMRLESALKISPCNTSIGNCLAPLETPRTHFQSHLIRTEIALAPRRHAWHACVRACLCVFVPIFVHLSSHTPAVCVSLPQRKRTHIDAPAIDL